MTCGKAARCEPYARDGGGQAAIDQTNVRSNESVGDRPRAKDQSCYCNAEQTTGHVNVFRFGPRTEFHFRVDRHDENGLQWTCTEADKVPDEWVGTTMTFKLTPQDSGTRIDFVHGEWQRADGDMPICNTTWGDLMYRLKDYDEGNSRRPRFS